MRHGVSIPNSIGDALDPEKRCESGDVDVQIEVSVSLLEIPPV